jgi:acyl-CoA thioesterase FadM
MIKLERTLTTRGYELDHEALIPPAVWLRYMEYLRWESLAEHPDTLGALWRGGDHFVIVAQKLDLLQEVSHTVELRASLWLGRVGRSSCDFRHRFRLGPTGQICARGVATAVLLDEQGRSMLLPRSLRELQASEEEESGSFLPVMDEPPPAAARTRRMEVRPSELDLLRHVNHASYLVTIDDTRQLVAAEQGYGEASGAARGRVRRVSLDYHAPTVMGDRLDVLTWMLDQRPPRLGFELRRVADDQLIGRACMELTDPKER